MTACGTARAALVSTEPGSAVTVGDETAVVLWDPTTHTEHLIDRVTFRDESGAPIAFVIPTPAQPQVNPAPDDPSRLLNHAYHPSYVHVEKTGVRPVSAFAWGMRKLSSMGSGSQEAESPAMQTWTNADYQATALHASEPDALSGWLRANGFAESNGVQSWLKPYADRGMALTAFKIQPSRSAGRTVRPPLIALTFQTDEPYFPNRRLPSDSASSDDRSRLRIYVITNNRLQAAAMPSSPHWAGSQSWAVPLPGDLSAQLSDNLTNQLGGVPAPALTQPWVSVFQEDIQAGSTGADLQFPSSADQTPQRPVVTVEKDSRVPVPFDALLFLGSLALAFRRRRVTGRQSGRTMRPRPQPALAADEPPAGVSTARPAAKRPEKPRKNANKSKRARAAEQQTANAAEASTAPGRAEKAQASKAARNARKQSGDAAAAMTPRQKNKMRKHKNHFGEMLRDAFGSGESRRETVITVKDPARNLTAPWGTTDEPAEAAPREAVEEPAMPVEAPERHVDFSELDLPDETDASLWIDTPTVRSATPTSFSLSPGDTDAAPRILTDDSRHLITDPSLVVLHQPRRSPFKRRKRPEDGHPHDISETSADGEE